MSKKNTEPAFTRRRVLVAGAAVAGAATLEAAPAIAAAAAADTVSWTPRFLTGDQAALLSRLCDLIIPRTATPGALDAEVPEWIDLAISLAEPSEQLEFLGGLGWVDRRANDTAGGSFVALDEKQQIELLTEISDGSDPADELLAGAEFFSDLKRRALFGFFTSKQGRVEVLGRPAKVERQVFEGCKHDGRHA